MDDYKIWIKRAHNSLALAKVEKTDEICYEDLCYNAQQAVEKGLKALLIFFDENISRSLKTHDLFVLLKKLEQYVEVPDEMIDAAVLTEYATGTRYPGDYEEVSEQSYQNAIKAAEYSLDWVSTQICDKCTADNSMRTTQIYAEITNQKVCEDMKNLEKRIKMKKSKK